METSHLPIGTLLQGGKYKIVRFISSGGFGCTYEAEHVLLEKRVAIKEFFVKDFCNRDETTAHVTVGTQSKKGLVEKLRRKFIDEAKAVCKLEHKNIVRVSDVFEENGTAYFVMDYIDGLSLSDILKKEDSLPEQRALKYIRQVADALQYVHDHNRLHLDVKPGNIIINEHDDAILIDFGTSKQYDEENGENTSTLMGKTPGYAPPEQMGNDVTKLLPATDIYALGATLYKILTGVTPISSELIISGEELDPLPDETSENVAKAITAAMQINKGKRPQSIAAFMSILDGDVAEDEVTVIPSVSLSTQSTQQPSSTSRPSNGYINGHEYVDMGLSVKWATCNVGASSPSDYGNYYAWGETRTKSTYTKKNCSTWKKNMGGIAGNPNYDAARANWGGTWRLPTKAEIQELIDNCTTEWTTRNGVRGRLVKSKKNGNSIFLPAAGYHRGASLYRAGEWGYYWSSSPNGSGTRSAYGLNFGSGNFFWDWIYRDDGQSVRPVSE